MEGPRALVREKMSGRVLPGSFQGSFWKARRRDREASCWWVRQGLGAGP